MKEEELLRYLKDRSLRAPLAGGIGDDCAVIEEEGRILLLTTDALVEGVHFEKRYFSLYHLGRKLAAVNLSDIAAMGGLPRYALLTLGLPAPPERSWVEEFFNGLEGRLQAFGARLVGGDTVRSPGGLFLNLALLGEASGGAIFRHGACPGDLIYVSRPLGASAAGLELLQRGLDVPASLFTAHLDPEPEVLLGRALAERSFPSAMMDVSDGLTLDLARLCEASGVGAVLEEAKVPVAPELLKAPLKRAPLWYALHGGEDYALLFTVPRERQIELEEFFSSLKRKAYLIGEIVSSPGLCLRRLDGEKKSLSPQGFDHFT